MLSLDRDPRLPNTRPDQRDRLPPATGKGSKPKRDEVKVTDPKTSPVDADVEAHRKLHASTGDVKSR